MKILYPALVLSIVVPGCSAPYKRPVKIFSPSTSSIVVQGYSVPALKGWQSYSYLKKGSTTNSVIFRRVIGSERSTINFTLFSDVPNSKSDGIVELRESVKSGLAIQGQFEPSLKVLNKQEKTFRGFPAIETKAQILNKDGTTEESRVLRVVDGKHTFWLSRSVRGNPLSAEATQQVDKAFDELSKGLKIPS